MLSVQQLLDLYFVKQCFVYAIILLQLYFLLFNSNLVFVLISKLFAHFNDTDALNA